MKNNLNIRENITLGPYTTLQVGGPARYFVMAKSEDDIAEAIAFAARRSIPTFVMGGGSNVLISDNGFDGLVLRVALKGIDTKQQPDGHVYLTAAAGEDWDAFVEYCVSRDLAGVENLIGIPGTVGGTPVQNVGAYGQEVSETIHEVRCFDRQEHRIVTLMNADCGFTYRTSIFNTSESDRYIVLGVIYRLSTGGAPKLAYKDLIDHFGERRPSLADVREVILRIRRKKSMVIDAADPNSRSAGSFFKNPVVSRETLDKLRRNFGQIPFFEFGTDVKIPAAWLIEDAGFRKGFVRGNVGISTNHSLAIINRGAATARQMIVLKNEIQDAVRSRFDIILQPEPVMIGF